jgi:CMP/dCMP kinase
MKKINIAIDGYCVTGKGTIAKLLAKALNYIYVDTGSMYRAATIYYIRNGKDEEKMLQDLENGRMIIGFVTDENRDTRVTLNGEILGQEIRTPEISRIVSELSPNPRLRSKISAIQREIAKNKGVVMEGRDIGTEILPDAEMKVFVICEDQVRAQRRLAQYRENGDEIITLDEVLKENADRDYNDVHRPISPLKKAEDAFVLDTSKFTINEEVDLLVKLAQDKMCVAI